MTAHALRLTYAALPALVLTCAGCDPFTSGAWSREEPEPAYVCAGTTTDEHGVPFYAAVLVGRSTRGALGALAGADVTITLDPWVYAHLTMLRVQVAVHTGLSLPGESVALSLADGTRVTAPLTGAQDDTATFDLALDTGDCDPARCELALHVGGPTSLETQSVPLALLGAVTAEVDEEHEGTPCAGLGVLVEVRDAL